MQKSCTTASSTSMSPGRSRAAMAAMTDDGIPTWAAIGAWIAHSTCWSHWRAVTRIASSDRRTPIALR